MEAIALIAKINKKYTPFFGFRVKISTVSRQLITSLTSPSLSLSLSNARNGSTVSPVPDPDGNDEDEEELSGTLSAGSMKRVPVEPSAGKVESKRSP